MNFYETFVTLCNEKNYSLNKACEKLGVSCSILNRWKTGSIPRDTTLLKIAKLFGVSTDFLLGKEEYIPMPKAEDCPPEVPAMECQKLRDLLSIISTCDEKQCEEIFKYAIYVKGKQ